MKQNFLLTTFGLFEILYFDLSGVATDHCSKNCVICTTCVDRSRCDLKEFRYLIHQVANYAEVSNELVACVKTLLSQKDCMQCHWKTEDEMPKRGCCNNLLSL